MLIHNAEIAAPRANEFTKRVRTDVRCDDGRITEIGDGLRPSPDETVVDAAGGAVLPGLHDHHIHLMALAAARASVPCGPPDVNDAAELRAALARAADERRRRGAGGWLRAVGYHESVAGELDRDGLDEIVEDVPLRVQHCSGAAWLLNSRACKEIGLDDGGGGGDVAEGVERDAAGRATGRLYRLDAWLSERTPASAPPSLTAVSRELAAYGVTGVTDATYTNDAAALAHVVGSIEREELLQHVVLMGTHGLGTHGLGTHGVGAHGMGTHGLARARAVAVGAVKLMVDERAPPTPEALCAEISRAHDAGRVVAMHCVTRAEIILACAALAAAGSVGGDRIEHASVAPPETVAQLADLGVTVVTQPTFVRERGDRYLVHVEERDRPWLYRLRAFDAAGVALGGGTDAPYGSADPWVAMRAAVDRTTTGGRALGADESITPERALALFTTSPDRPGGKPRAVRIGAPADLVVLRAPWAEARRRLSSELVETTVRGGRIV